MKSHWLGLRWELRTSLQLHCARPAPYRAFAPWPGRVHGRGNFPVAPRFQGQAPSSISEATVAACCRRPHPSMQIWQTTYAALTGILFLDAALAPCTRLSRPLRPIMLVLRPDLRPPEATQYCFGFGTCDEAQDPGVSGTFTPQCSAFVQAS